MDENFENYDLENLIIKDKQYYRKRKIKCLLFWIPLILVIGIVITLVVLLRPKPDNKIICHYQTQDGTENTTLININNNIEYNIIINDTNCGKINSYKLNKDTNMKLFLILKIN